MAQQSTNPDNPSGKGHWRGYAQAGLIILVIAAALYLARAPQRAELGPVSAPADAAPSVQVIVPSQTKHVLEIDLTGTVTLDRKLAVVSEAEGRVVWVSLARQSRWQSSDNQDGSLVEGVLPAGANVRRA